MPTMNKIDLLDCAAGHHNFSDDASECHVCGLPDLDASIPAPADPVRDAAPDMLAALRIAREALLYAAAKVLDKPDWQPGEYAHLMQAKEHADRAIAKAEGAA